jgi:hypothetical protein
MARPAFGTGDRQPLASITYPMWRIGVGQHRILFFGVPATGAMEPYGFAAHD